MIQVIQGKLERTLKCKNCKTKKIILKSEEKIPMEPPHGYFQLKVDYICCECSDENSYFLTNTEIIVADNNC